MSATFTQNSCTEVTSSSKQVVPSTDTSKEEALQKVKEAIATADKLIAHAIDFVNKWPKDVKVSLEEKKRSLTVLGEVKELTLQWAGAMSAAEFAISEVIRTIDFLSSIIDKSTLYQYAVDQEKERNWWTVVRGLAKDTHENWCKRVNWVESLAAAAVNGEDKWRPTVTTEMTTTSLSLNTGTEVRTDAKPLVNTDAKYIYLGSYNDCNYSWFEKRQKKYTERDMVAFETIKEMAREAGILLEIVSMVIYVGFHGGLYKYGSHIRSLYQWTQVKGRLLALEPPPLPSSGAQMEAKIPPK
jgi:hypothetical protein